MSIKMKSNEKGFGLLELMLSLVIVALLLVMATRYYQSTLNSQRATQTIQKIQAISAAAEQVSMATGEYGTALSASVQKIIDLKKSPWGTAVTLTRVSGGKYTIGMTGVSPSACAQLEGALGAGYSSVSCTDAGALTVTFDRAAKTSS